MLQDPSVLTSTIEGVKNLTINSWLLEFYNLSAPRTSPVKQIFGHILDWREQDTKHNRCENTMHLQGDLHYLSNIWIYLYSLTNLEIILNFQCPVSSGGVTRPAKRGMKS